MHNMFKTPKVAFAALTVFAFGFGLSACGQSGLDNTWTGGYGDAGVLWGGVVIYYPNGDQVITTADWPAEYNRTCATISDQGGSLLFSSNGVMLYNSLGDTMQNGAGLSPSWYTTELSGPPCGLALPQATLIIPKPGSANIYYLFHGTYDNPPGALAKYLYLSTIDMSLDGGLGAVVNKNQVLLDDDSLGIGKITAVKHANGRDWWVFCHQANSSLFYRFLVTPAGVLLDGTQAIGTLRTPDFGQVCFSPDGQRFAYYSGFNEDLDLFDFDRCTGLLSNPVHVDIEDGNAIGGVAFAPNSRYLYVSSYYDVYQFDAEADDLTASMVTIAQWDSTYSPSPPFAALFDLAQMAPDGKVYISTGNSTLVLHVVNEPDSAGTACNMGQHAIALPHYIMNSLPNHPNYHLGPVDGSVCDSLGLNAGLNAALSGAEGYLRAAPNPTQGQFMLSYLANPQVGWLEVRDLTGRIVKHERIPQWSTVHEVSLHGQAAGLYQCTLRWGMQAAGTRIILLEQ